MIKRLIPLVAVAGVAYVLGLFTPVWVSKYEQHQFLVETGRHCSELAKQTIKPDTDNKFYHACFRENLDAHVETAVSQARSKAQEEAAKLD
ncbi:hypothetical protein [Paraburkholderia largidicola]|uniref:Uncharacterized protein n=1 Tax=Paraburkholderia largidicola TaxID=3014751 RepID=A0A7I8C624_9BURK|nr:hypothetical protein [Paraburkholderia sp. PGU16]BCF95270.1 hypothetical protein PPGU16_83370 [Paraburkholderia sp. PGU16]